METLAKNRLRKYIELIYKPIWYIFKYKNQRLTQTLLQAVDRLQISLLKLRELSGLMNFYSHWNN